LDGFNGLEMDLDKGIRTYRGYSIFTSLEKWLRNGGKVGEIEGGTMCADLSSRGITAFTD
jgi:hypothetical protein